MENDGRKAIPIIAHSTKMANWWFATRSVDLLGKNDAHLGDRQIEIYHSISRWALAPVSRWALAPVNGIRRQQNRTLERSG